MKDRMRTTRRAILYMACATLATASLGRAAYADETGSATAFLKEVYGLYEKRSNWQGVSFTPGMRQRYFSADLAALWTGMEKDFGKAGLVGPIDFDPVTQGHGETPITHLSIGKPVIKGSEGEATVTFSSGSSPTTLRLKLKREEGGWRIDDIAQPQGQYAWDLRKMLAEAYKDQFGQDFVPAL